MAIEIDAGDAASAIIGIETKYHEHALAEAPPKPAAMSRYSEVTDRSGAFIAGWRERIIGTDLQQIWLDHLLVLAMLQHPSKRWRWGRFVLLYPAPNPSFAAAASRYRDVLIDVSTYEARAIEEMVLSPSALPELSAAAVRERYLLTIPSGSS